MSLLRLEVELHPEAFSVGVPEAEGVAPVAVHESRAHRDTAVRHQDRDLVQALGAPGPEVPHGRRRAQVGARMAFLRADEVRELERVADEEDRRVVAHEIPVALVRVELDREAADIALRVRRAEFARHRGEARQYGRALVEFGEEAGARVPRDVMGHGEGTVRAPSLRVYDPLRNPLPVLVRQLLDEVVVLQEQRPARSCGQAVLVVGDGIAAAGRHGLHGSIGHRVSLSERPGWDWGRLCPMPANYGNQMFLMGR